MKRKAVKAILCAALMALTLSMTACGGSDDANSADVATEEETKEEEKEEVEEPKEEEKEAEEPKAEEPEEVEEPEEEESTAGGETLEDYLNSTPGAKEAIEEQIAGASQEGMSVTAEVKGNDFIFNFTIEDESVLTDDAPTQLEAGLEATASIFEQMAGQMDEVIEQEGVVQIVIKYLDPDGNVLAERGFKAQ